jgi:hypothetical protein
MKASKQGIEVSKAELSALLFFAGKADSAVVKFRVDAKGKLIVGATDGKRAAECEASSGDHERGEWTVPGDYLELLRRGANKGRTDVLLKVDAKGLRHALLVGAASRDPAQEVVDKKNGTSTQVSMESLHKLVKGVQLSGSWFAIVPKHVNKALDVVCKAADGCPVTIYPPQGPTDHVLFEASSEAGRWRGKLQPAVVEAPGGEADEPEEEPDEPLFGKGKNTASADEEDDDDGSGIVDDDYADKAKKKAAKKAPARGFMHLIDSANKNGTLCGGRAGTSVGSGGTTSKENVDCPKCLVKLDGKPAAKKPRKGK